MNPTGAELVAGGAAEFGAVALAGSFDEATLGWLLSLVELQLDKPSALIKPKTAIVSTIRPGVQKLFPGPEVFALSDEAI